MLTYVGPGPGQDDEDWDDGEDYDDRIDSALKKILPQATVLIERGMNVDWIDIELFDNKVTIERHANDKFGIVIPDGSGYLKMADYYLDNHIDALDVAIKLLTE